MKHGGDWMSHLEQYFARFRSSIIGQGKTFLSPYGEKRIIYADWIASGRLYEPIEEKLLKEFGPFVANTHTESNETGTLMTKSLHEAHQIIKRHVQANDEDVIITDGSGMTGVVNKFQRILGLRVPERFKEKITLSEEERPIIFVTHMEHHSNHTSWVETIGDVRVLQKTEDGRVDLDHLISLLEKYQHRQVKIGSFTACSNVTGVETPYHEIAKVMHQYGGLCFVDFAASAPYVSINMHPEDPLEKLDAIFFSPHKFLGGPGTSGVLIFDSKLYSNLIPDHPGGGTVTWTNPWGGRSYVTNIEERESGGTPGFLQAIKAALSIKLKEEMGTNNMLAREKELMGIIFNELEQVPTIHILDGHIKERIGIISFYVEEVPYNLFVRLLNDRYGIQVRGGCSCAGTYGHFLLNISEDASKRITDQIDCGILAVKPGWVRLSVHPTMTNEESFAVASAIKNIVSNHEEWKKDYVFHEEMNDYVHTQSQEKDIDSLFELNPLNVTM